MESEMTGDAAFPDPTEERVLLEGSGYAIVDAWPRKEGEVQLALRVGHQSFDVGPRLRQRDYDLDSLDDAARWWATNIASAIDRIERLAWVRMEDRLPPVGLEVMLVWSEQSGGGITDGYLKDDGGCFNNWDWHCECPPSAFTHWRLMPKGPGEEK